MTIDDLISRLEECRDEFGGEAEVRLMTQQNWPFENAIHGVTSGREINGESEDDDDDVANDAMIYLVEGRQIAYGSKRAWDVCGQ
jgi:hypothetical protein